MRPLGLISISVRAMRVADFILKVSASLGVIAMSLAPGFMLWFVAQSEPDSASVVMACLMLGVVWRYSASAVALGDCFGLCAVGGLAFGWNQIII